MSFKSRVLLVSAPFEAMRHENGPPWAGLLQQWCQGACDDVKLQLPWPFKPLHSLGQQAFTQSTSLRARIMPQQRKKLSAEEQGDAEERALAIALSGRQKATLLEFYSPRCTLCQSLLKVVHDVERREGDWLNIVMADVENKKWLPEVHNSSSHSIISAH